MVESPAPRIPLQLEIEYRRNYARRGDTGRLKNISLSGAFLEFGKSSALETREKVVLHFSVSGRNRRIQAEVVWRSEAGCGVKFNHSNNRDQQIVDDLMYFVENSRFGQRHLLDSIFKKVS
jgi:hypothetical protein